MLAPTLAAKAACAPPEMRAVVDAAFARQGGPAQRRMESEVCPTCPIWHECLTDALANGEHGPWGGTNERKRRQFVKRPSRYNMREVQHPKTASVDGGDPLRHRDRGREHSTSRQVKEWAVSTGLLPYVARGTVAGWVRDAYDEVHPHQAAS